jgi:hypothetical protein
MGGMGSGNWYRWQGRKTTVEECWTLDANRWMREGILGAEVQRSGSRTWRDSVTKEARASIGYEVRTDRDGTGWLRLRYTLTRTREEVNCRIALATTRPHLGGLRWWFICPLAVNGRVCRRRSGKLYLGGRYFGCRVCHKLTYRSSQEAHQSERSDRMLFRLAAQFGESGLGDLSEMTSGELIGLLKASRRLK